MIHWFLDYRKNESEIWVSSNDYSIFVGEGYTPKEKKSSKELARVIIKALNDYEEKNEEDFANSLRENDSGHQPC